MLYPVFSRLPANVPRPVVPVMARLPPRPDDAQHRHDVIESLLALADFRLLLRGVVAVQGVQPVQVLLILAVVLGIDVVVRLAFCCNWV